MLTKYIFEHIRAPVAMSTLSCIVTAFILLPVIIYKGQWRTVHLSEVCIFTGVCAAVAADLAFTNIGLSILPLAFQQSIKSTLPIATIAIEFLVLGKKVSVGVLAIVIGICLGPFVLSLDKDWEGNGEMLYGVVMLSCSIVAGALKYVLAHSAIKRYKKDMGIMGFIFWMEIFATVLLLPWSIVNGEMEELISGSQNWPLLVGTSAFGGVRILSQFYFLNKTSATSLAASNIAIQVGLTLAGTLFFDDPVTICLILGSSITFVMSSSYAYLKYKNSPTYTHVVENNDPEADATETESLQMIKR